MDKKMNNDNTDYVSNESGTLSRLFKLPQHGTTVRTELIAGMTTFLTMVYIVFVNPQILGAAQMDPKVVFVTTCLIAGIGSIAMGVFANLPVALAPAMGLNAFFAFVVVGAMGISWQTGMGAIFWGAVGLFLLTLFRIRYWIMLATLAVVFVVGFRVLTSGARKAIRRLSDRLNIDVVPVESMVDQMGKSAGDEFLRYLHRPDESHLQNAAQVLLIWQIVIVDGSEQNLLQWHRILQKARLAAPITDAQVRLALGFLRETEPEMQDINAFQMRYNAFFQPAEGVHWLH
ncbi:solute carrier family 23 protein [Escherichia coli]